MFIMFPVYNDSVILTTLLKTLSVTISFYKLVYN